MVSTASGLLSRFMLLLVLATSIPAWAGDLDAQVDHTILGVDETLTLTLTLHGQDPGDSPDFSALNHDFDVLGTQQGSRVNIVNGSMDASTQWIVQLAPRHDGTITIPSLSVGGAHSKPVIIKVAKQVAANSDRGLSLETEINPESPYVQGQLIYTVKLYYALPISNGELSAPSADNAVIEPLGKDKKYETLRHGRRYEVLERRYAIFPQQSGSLTIHAPVFTGKARVATRHDNSMFGRMFNNDPAMDPFGLFAETRPVHARAAERNITVRPKPGNAGEGPWLPAQALTLSESWSADPPEFRVGEPITRTVVIAATGLTGAQLPDLPLADNGDAKLYPDQPKVTTNTDGDVVVGNRVLKTAIVPTHAGALTLPAITLQWWDTESDTLRTARIPQEKFQVLPAAGGNIAPPPAPQPSTAQSPILTRAEPSPQTTVAPVSRDDTSAIWMGLSIAFGVLWLSTLGLWWWQHRHNHRLRAQVPEPADPQPSLRQARKAVREACRANDGRACRDALLDWARSRWPETPPTSLPALARKLDDSTAQGTLAELDRCLYRGGRWDGQESESTLASALQATERKTASQRGASGLPDLYAGA